MNREHFLQLGTFVWWSEGLLMVEPLMGGDWAMANLALVPQTMVLVSWAIAN